MGARLRNWLWHSGTKEHRDWVENGGGWGRYGWQGRRGRREKLNWPSCLSTTYIQTSTCAIYNLMEFRVYIFSHNHCIHDSWHLIVASHLLTSPCEAKSTSLMVIWSHAWADAQEGWDLRTKRPTACSFCSFVLWISSEVLWWPWANGGLWFERGQPYLLLKIPWLTSVNVIL